MTVQKVYYIGTDDSHSFRPGEAAEIIAVAWITPPGTNQEPRACFQLRYADDTLDSCPISDTSNYKLTPDVRCKWVQKEPDSDIPY